MLVDVYAVFADTCGRGFAGNKIAPKANEAQGYVPFFLKLRRTRAQSVKTEGAGPPPPPRIRGGSGRPARTAGSLMMFRKKQGLRRSVSRHESEFSARVSTGSRSRASPSRFRLWRTEAFAFPARLRGNPISKELRRVAGSRRWREL